MSDNMEIRFDDFVRLDLGNTIPVPVRDYLLMVHKPQINGQELAGNLIIKLGNLENDVGYLTEEVDPTVPSWAKQPTKPSYTPQEIGAMPDTVVIPVRVSQLENDTGYYVKPVTGIPITDLEQGLIPTKLSQLNNDLGFYVKPVNGIPAADIDTSLIQAIRGKLDASQKGVPNGVAELDQNGMIRSYQLPSYVDDVKAYASISYFPVIGEDDKIYIAKDTNLQYRWGGPDVGYITIGTSLAIGETANTAYRGDRGKTAYDHAMAKGSQFVSGLYKITTNAEGHVVSAIPVSKADIEALGIPGSQPDVSGFYTKPVSGIPAEDLASGVIPDVSGFYTKPVSGIPASDLAAGVIPTIAVTDVQIDGTTILNNGAANVPLAGQFQLGVIKTGYSSTGIFVASDGTIYVSPANDATVKSGNGTYTPITPTTQHKSVYYALAKLAGADMASVSGETVGVYPEAQKAAIQSMLGVSTGAILIENVSGSTPSITALPNVRYKCGEVSTLSITPPASGSCEVIFSSGSTATLLTVPNTVKFPPWFDVSSLAINTIYDIIITDGVYGAVMAWAS